MPAELFPLAAALSGGRLGPEIAIAIIVNVGGTIACAAGLRWALKDVPNVPESVTAWPWEPQAWGFPKKADSSAAAPEGAAATESEPAAPSEAAPAEPQAPAPEREKAE
jgi:hypothetical protein